MALTLTACGGDKSSSSEGQSENGSEAVTAASGEHSTNAETNEQNDDVLSWDETESEQSADSTQNDDTTSEGNDLMKTTTIITDQNGKTVTAKSLPNTRPDTNKTAKSGSETKSGKTTTKQTTTTQKTTTSKIAAPDEGEIKPDDDGVLGDEGIHWV